MTTSPIERAADSFAAELTQRRIERGMTKKQLAARMGFDPSYVSHIEGRRHRPTEDFARRAEAVLAAGGAIWQRFQEYDELRRMHGGQPHRESSSNHWLPPHAGLIVEREEATLSYRDGAYRSTVRRTLYNAGTEPVTRYLIRIAVDRYPNDPERSNRHHRKHPLSYRELGLTAYCGGAESREPMDWRTKQDRDAVKEVWLLFQNSRGQFPLYPGRRAEIEYSYTVGEEKWGPWFQRAIRLPTRRLTVRLDFPVTLKPHVWGVESSLFAGDTPLRTPLNRRDEDGRAIFEWSTEAPPLNTRYRMEWHFRGRDGEESDLASLRASDRMRAAGIVQRGAEVLHQRAREFDLPSEEAVALEVVAQLRDALARVDEIHHFSKGVGLAAPQLGLSWAAAVVRPPDPTAEPVVLLNPRIVDASLDTDEQYEGCLSFFDVRGRVRRPLRIHVEHSLMDGSRVITTFDRAMARLVAHEIDHLEGRLYTDRMPDGEPLVPIEEYHETGQAWSYC
ncbi:MAG TPA: peptide deformylase [Micromonospora sp.]